MPLQIIEEIFLVDQMEKNQEPESQKIMDIDHQKIILQPKLLTSLIKL